MKKIEIYQFPYNSDNYGVLLHDSASGQTACVDAGDFHAYKSALDEKGWVLNQIWMTHHHWDHTDGLAALKSDTGAHVFGPKSGSRPISGLDTYLSDGECFSFAECDVFVLETPGHTLDMVNFYIADQKIVFTGDTLFALGCGRLLEGTPAQMWNSISKLMQLPDDTLVYCSHEYSQTNAEFALSIDPNNAMLIERKNEINLLRAQEKSTIPTSIGIERATNPFVRSNNLEIRAHLNMPDASDEDVFTEIRKRKDNF